MTPRKESREVISPEPFLKESRIPAAVGWVATGALVVGLGIPLIAVLRFALDSQDLQTAALGTAITVFLCLTILTFLFLVLAGLRVIQVSESFMKWLGGATIVELAGIAGLIFKYLLR